MILNVQDLCVEKAGNSVCYVPQLKVEPGERIAIVGPNGSGKTTLLRVLGGLERDIRGECTIEPPMRKRVYVHQRPYLFRGSVMFNVGYGLAARSVARHDRKPLVRHWLSIFDIGHLAGRHCNKLSGGERRRVALARAFAVGAELMLLDEPLADLDAQGIDILTRAISDRLDATILIASPVPLPATIPARSYQFPSSTR